MRYGNEGIATHSWTETSLHASYTLVPPCLHKYVQDILIHTHTTILGQLALQLHACFGNIWDIGESDLEARLIHALEASEAHDIPTRTATHAATPPKMNPSAVDSGRGCLLVVSVLIVVGKVWSKGR